MASGMAARLPISKHQEMLDRTCEYIRYFINVLQKEKNNCFQTTLATGAMEAAMVGAEAMVVVVATRAMEAAMVVAEAMVVVATRAMAVAEAMEVVTKAMEVSVLVICIT